MIPATFGLQPHDVQAVLGTAGQAPSLHNSQPWNFRLSAQAIELCQDTTRQLGVADPRGEELRLACGAALLNLRLALHAHHIRPLVTLLPDTARPDLLAVVRHGGSKQPTPEQERLHSAIPLRRTNRRPFIDEPVTVPERYALRRAALDENTWLHFVEDPEQREQVRKLAVSAHAHQRDDPAFRAEFDAWTAAPDSRTDGVRARTGGPLPDSATAWVLRDFTGGNAPRSAGSAFEENPLIVVLTPHLTGHYADLQAGQALQRVLLTATTLGLDCSFLSQLIEVSHAREELRRCLGVTHAPSVVLRIGRGWPVTRSGRRPVGELVEPSPPRITGSRTVQ